MYSFYGAAILIYFCVNTIYFYNGIYLTGTAQKLLYPVTAESTSYSFYLVKRRNISFFIIILLFIIQKLSFKMLNIPGEDYRRRICIIFTHMPPAA